MSALRASREAARRQQALDDELVGTVRRHGEERAADQPREHGVRSVESRIEVDHVQLVGGGSLIDDGAPAAGHGLAEQHRGRDAADDVHRRLEDLGPDHGAHAALVCVDHRQRAQDQHGSRHHVLARHDAIEDQRDRNRGRKDAYRVRHAARDHEHDRREAPRREAESLLQQRVGGDEIALVVPRQQRVRDHDAAQDVARRDLEEAEIREVRETRDTDERQRAGLARDDREHHRPPGDRAVGDEVVLRVFLSPPDPDTEQCRANQVDDDDRDVERRDACDS